VTSAPDIDASAETIVIPLYEEEANVVRRTVAAGTVRVATVTREREQLVDQVLTSERFEIERVPVGRVVETAPPDRTEGDLTIMPVVEEIIVVERRLILKEEIHIRRVRQTERHRESVTMRTQDAVVTRIEAGMPKDGETRRSLETEHLSSRSKHHG
jgi:stress response protein YsnF